MKYSEKLFHSVSFPLGDFNAEISDLNTEFFCTITGANLGFSRDRGPNFRKRADQYKTKNKGI